MSTAPETTSKTSGTRTVTTTAVVRIGSRSPGSLLEAAETKLSNIETVSTVTTISLSELTPKNGNTVVTVKAELRVPNSVEPDELEETASSMFTIKSLQC